MLKVSKTYQPSVGKLFMMFILITLVDTLFLILLPVDIHIAITKIHVSKANFIDGIIDLPISLFVYSIFWVFTCRLYYFYINHSPEKVRKIEKKIINFINKRGYWKTVLYSIAITFVLRVIIVVGTILSK